MTYGVYGVHLESDWRLPYPKASAGGHLAEVTLRRGTAAQFTSALGAHQLNCSSAVRSDLRLADGSTYLRWTGALDFLIPRDGKTLLCRPLHDGAEAAFHIHLGPSLSFALLNLGLEPLHATTVVVDGAAVALMGDCGYGKSSLGAAFVRAGLPLLTDDLLVLTHDTRRVLAYPQTARKIFGARVKGLRLNRFTNKLIVPLPGARAHSTAVPLKAIYVLTPPWRRTPARLGIRPMTPRQAFMEIVRNTFNRSITDPPRLERQFALAARLSDGVPIKSLSYPREFSMLREAREAILRDLAA
jgi:hypothetical protein